MIGSIIGVGRRQRALCAGRDGTSGVDWGKATEIGESVAALAHPSASCWPPGCCS